METARIDQLLQYAILVAGSEEYGRRRLGPIHLIKYAYLGDLAYAEEHPGETFTKAPWRFFHYGPWSEAVANRIEPAMHAVGAKKHVFTSRFDKDAERFELIDEEQRRELERLLPFEVARAIRRAVHEHADATADLLHEVYLTWPMVHAAPGEDLMFNVPAREERPRVATPASTMPESKTARRKREAQLDTARRRIREALERRRATVRLVEPPIKPRYDEVYFQGLSQLDEIGGKLATPAEGTLEIDDGIWKSPFRTDTDLP